MTPREKETILTGLELLTDEQRDDLVFCLKTIRELPTQRQRDELLAVCGFCLGKNARKNNSVTQGR